MPSPGRRSEWSPPEVPSVEPGFQIPRRPVMPDQRAADDAERSRASVERRSSPPSLGAQSDRARAPSCAPSGSAPCSSHTMHPCGSVKRRKPPRTIATPAFHMAPPRAPRIAHSFPFADCLPIFWRHLQTLLGEGIARLIEGRWHQALATGARRSAKTGTSEKLRKGTA